MKWIYRHPSWYDAVDSLCSLSLSDRARRKVLGGVSGGSFLEIGAGTGKSFQAVGSVLKLGIDISVDMLQHAARRIPDAALVVGDAHKLPFQNACIDVSVFSYCLRGLDRPVEAVKEALRVSSEVIIIDYDKPRLVPSMVWERLINWFGWEVFGSRDLDYRMLMQLGDSSRAWDLYGGLYKVVILKGAVNAQV